MRGNRRNRRKRHVRTIRGKRHARTGSLEGELFDAAVEDGGLDSWGFEGCGEGAEGKGFGSCCGAGGGGGVDGVG